MMIIGTDCPSVLQFLLYTFCKTSNIFAVSQYSTYRFVCLVQGDADQVREAAWGQTVCLSARPEAAGAGLRVPSPPGQLRHVQAHPRREQLVKEQEQEVCVWEQRQCPGTWSTAGMCGDSFWVHSNNTSTLIVEKTTVKTTCLLSVKD